MARIKRWTTYKPEELVHAWQAHFQSQEEALAHAIWVANRLIKDRAQSTKRKFYELKDEWLTRQQDHLIEGRIARKESSACYRCKGTGRLVEDWLCPLSEHDWHLENPEDCRRCRGTEAIQAGDPCPSCAGTGMYKVRCLYEHHLLVAGTRYCLHSYIQPRTVSDTPGADRESYGGRFTEEELADLALPVTGLIQVISFLLGLRWSQLMGGWTAR